MLAGCGKVCIRSTAQRSTGELGSFPSEGSLHKTRRSLQRMPTNGLGVSSGARQSTCTVDASPWALNASNDTTAFRTTRVNRREPSIIKRLGEVSMVGAPLQQTVRTCEAERAGWGTFHVSVIATEPTSSATRIHAFLRSCCLQATRFLQGPSPKDLP